MKSISIIPLVGFALSAAPCFAHQAQAQTQTEPPARAEDPAYTEDWRSDESYTEESYTTDDVLDQSDRAPASRPVARPQKSEAVAKGESGRPMIAPVDVTPTIGALGIKDRSAFTIGSNVAFRLISEDIPLFFEPSLLVSFLSGDTGSPNATLFHIDGGVRYDLVIPESPIVPFVKAAVGPTVSDNSTIVNGGEVSGTELNLFAGGGLKYMPNASIGARADGGLTLQATDAGYYALGSVILPL